MEQNRSGIMHKMNCKYRRHHRRRHRLGIPRHLSETKRPVLAPQASFSLSLFQDRVESEKANDSGQNKRNRKKQRTEDREEELKERERIVIFNLLSHRLCITTLIHDHIRGRYI